MKRKPTVRSTAVYDFDEGDAEPYRAKVARRNEFFEAFSKGSHFSSNGPKAELDDCEDLTGRHTQALCFESSLVKERNGNQSSSVSDVIESDNSDSESSQGEKALGTRFEGVLVSSGTFEDEDLEAGLNREIVMHGKELWLSHGNYSSPELIFTEDAIEFRIEGFGAVKLPLSMITHFRSCSNEDISFVELGLKECGGQLLQHFLVPSDIRSLSDRIISTFSDSVSLAEKIKQILSLSDGYKSIWRPCNEYITPQNMQSAFQGREGFDSAKSGHLLSDCILQRSTSRLNEWYDLIYPTEGDRDAVTVTKYDYLLLDPDQFLSDTIIDFYIKYLQRLIPETQKHRFYFYNSFFFRKLTDASKNVQIESSKSAFERVKRWTAGVGILDKDYLFIPIMQNSHWSLVIICDPKYLSAGCSDASDSKVPVILHFDSLEGCHTCIEEPIRSYLMEAWREKDTHRNDARSVVTLKFVALKVPQQTNYSDCGLFLLHYVELFIGEILDKTFFEPELEEQPFREWFNPMDASRKRSQIQDLIEKLRPKKSSEEHSGSQLLADSCMFGPLELVQRPASFGPVVCNNLFDQACDAICSHQHHHHGNDISLSSCTRLGHEQAELECVEVEGEPCQAHHHSFMDQLDRFSPLRQQAAASPVAALLMPCCTHVEYDNVMQSHDYALLDDDLECDTSDTNLDEFHASVREDNDQPDQCVAEAADVSGKSNLLEESFTSASSHPFVNSRTDAQVGLAFCCHYGNVRVFDKVISSAEKFSMEKTSCEDVFHVCPDSSSSSIERAGSPPKVDTVALDGSADASQDLRGESPGYPVVWLDGLEAVTIVDANLSTQHTSGNTNAGLTQPAVVERCLEIGIDGTCKEGLELQQVAGTAANIIEDTIKESEESTLALSSKEEGFCASNLQSTEKENGAVIKAGLDKPHLIPADMELKPKLVNKLAESKSSRESQRNKKSKVDSPARRITRSLAKDQDQGKGK